MTTFSLHLSDTTSEDTRQAILAPLRAYNQSKTGPLDHRGLAIELRDEQGATIGGLWGGTSFGWLFIQLLAVPETLRGQGVGRALMAQAEAEAASRGCHAVWLDTFEFQARGFYERLGYTCFGQLENFPTGFARFFMQKSIAAAQSPSTSEDRGTKG
jgi:GNAT superfamily N-acetyltransferase